MSEMCNPPRRFRLVLEDTLMAFGVLWSDNSATVRWFGDDSHQSFVIWPDMERAVERSFSAPGSKVPVVLEWIDT